MTQPTPPAPSGPPWPMPAPEPPAPAPPAPAGPPAPGPPVPAPPPAPPPPEPTPDAATLLATLERERAKTRDVERQLAELQRQGMTQTQRQIEDARQEGRQAAIREAGTRVAVEAFRTAATGRFP